MKWLFLIPFLICTSTIFADQGITASSISGVANGTVTRGSKQIVFVIETVGTYTFGNATLATGGVFGRVVIPIEVVGDNQTLGELSYGLTSGRLKVIEVR